MIVWKCKLIFTTDTLQQKMELKLNNWIKTIFLAGENTVVLIILANYLANNYIIIIVFYWISD